jgi:hypothetical protein
MVKLFQSILSANRRHRSLTIRSALWLMRSVRDAENDEMCRYSDKLDKFDSEPDIVSRHIYVAVEEEYSTCETALEFLNSALEFLEFAY